MTLTDEDKLGGKRSSIQFSGSIDGEQQMSVFSVEQMREAEEWGKGNDGYVAGGNFEDDPNLKLYTVRRY